MAPFIIPIFISHQGCPQRCIFCDQYTITGHTREEGQPVTPATVQATIELYLQRRRKERQGPVQVAFYGGSFTGLPSQRQRKLLGAVQPYIRTGQVDALRISTRPDYVDGTVLSLLKEYRVSIVELGIQSMVQEVLDASCRGHSAQQSEKALRLLRAHGFTVGAQVMCGLPRDTTASLMATARNIADLAPDFVRIYPVLVLKGSGLEQMYRKRTYRPLSLAKAVVLGCRLKSIFEQRGIKVVRLGLQPTEELGRKVVAGPYHPSFGELVRSRLLFKKTRKVLHDAGRDRVKKLAVAAADESAFRGPGNICLQRLIVLGLLAGVDLVFDREQERNSVAVY